jgi:hypothetical protein
MNAVFHLCAKCNKAVRVLNVKSTPALEQAVFAKQNSKLKNFLCFFPGPLVKLRTILIHDVSHYHVLFVFNTGLNHFEFQC